ncbi:hypothetical protein [Mucilaginibacter aquariorum]|uniref:Uncharacterized protein n=1 Tax=Mucilaginibacter aquariorum TaxID=2967225 RepID=A0ABT1T751_9SPHI|nr:hypothetical protein [Mucilaginibacter aquariorum]MCQ6960292.1 hypothetical protein [Mucilaginibacter aquariorum]
MEKDRNIAGAFKLKVKIYFTNWINVLGIIIGTYVFLVVTELFKTGISALPQMLIMAMVAIVLYGGIFFTGFLISMLILDLILMNDNTKHLRLKLIVEWGLISVPFVYWLLEYSEWIFLVAVIFFFIMQFIREKRILKILA